MSSMIDGPASYRLYPIFRRNSFRALISAGPSTPFGGLPSITPITPRPCSVFATITSTGLAVAQKIEHTSGMFCTTFSRFMGYALRRMRTNTCPALRAWAFAMAAFRSSVALCPGQTWAGRLVERQPELGLWHGVHHRLVHVLRSFDEVRLADNNVGIFRELHPNRFKLDHGILSASR